MLDLLVERDELAERWAEHRLACGTCHLSGGIWCAEGQVVANLLEETDLELAARRDG